MTAYTIQLPAGTDVTHLVNLPLCGSWLGLVSISLITSVNATVHEALLIWDTGLAQRWYRRFGGTQAGNWEEWTLAAQRRPSWWLLQNESLFQINYTASAPISLCVETNRSVTPNAHPQTSGLVLGNQVNGTLYQA